MVLSIINIAINVFFIFFCVRVIKKNSRIIKEKKEEVVVLVSKLPDESVIKFTKDKHKWMRKIATAELNKRGFAL